MKSFVLALIELPLPDNNLNSHQIIIFFGFFEFQNFSIFPLSLSCLNYLIGALIPGWPYLPLFIPPFTLEVSEIYFFSFSSF